MKVRARSIVGDAELAVTVEKLTHVQLDPEYGDRLVLCLNMADLGVIVPAMDVGQISCMNTNPRDWE